ncbi:MAG: host attachment protein [Gammaproteobacteria bacterium]|jgi:protein required for attachment to host cells|nr:host attachment protein [Gammaproteobacteria bacterium]
MNEYCVVVANASRARFFTLEEPKVPEVESARLIERDDLVDPEATLAGREAWSDTRSGANAGPGGALTHRYDDHRDAHDQERGRRFARRIAGAALDMVREQEGKCLVVVAGNRMLGHLRPELETPAGGIEVREAAKDLTALGPRELLGHLVTAGLLPAR